MKKDFFEGTDFQGKFKALMPEYYPPKYQRYIHEETMLLREKMRGATRVLEAGVGIGRLIPALAPLVDTLVCIDHATLMLREARRVARQYSNVVVKKMEIELVATKFCSNYFDHSLCVWNTLGNVDDEVTVLTNLRSVTKESIFITVYHKGTLKDRAQWYQTLHIPIKSIDQKREIFYSESGLRSRSYSEKDIQRLARRAGLQVRDCLILGGVILWCELVHKDRVVDTMATK